MPQLNPQAEDSQEKTPAAATTLRARVRTWCRRFWLIPAFAGLVLLQILGMNLYRWAFPPRTLDSTHEVSLGEFGFEATEATRSDISQIDFALHISLIPELDAAARRLLKEHRFLLEQNVEELLRQAAPGDFEDPSLSELKRQIQATINQTVGRRIVAEVIITDLAVLRSGPQQVQTAESESAGTTAAPWQEAAPASPAG